MSDIAVQAENIHKSYVLGATAVGALRGVDLSVMRGEFVALMGPSGCGKTTLLNLIGALDTPSRGTLRVDGVALETLTEDQLADIVARITKWDGDVKAVDATYTDLAAKIPVHGDVTVAFKVIQKLYNAVNGIVPMQEGGVS